LHDETRDSATLISKAFFYPNDAPHLQLRQAVFNL